MPGRHASQPSRGTVIGGRRPGRRGRTGAAAPCGPMSAGPGAGVVCAAQRDDRGGGHGRQAARRRARPGGGGPRGPSGVMHDLAAALERCRQGAARSTTPPRCLRTARRRAVDQLHPEAPHDLADQAPVLVAADQHVHAAARSPPLPLAQRQHPQRGHQGQAFVPEDEDRRRRRRGRDRAGRARAGSSACWRGRNACRRRAPLPPGRGSVG